MSQVDPPMEKSQNSNDILLRSRRFRTEREQDWKTLEQLLKRAEGGRLRNLSDEEILLLPRVYRSALSALSVARTTSLDHELVEYLEALCSRAYFYIYGARTSLADKLGRFFATDWSHAVMSLWRETVASALFMALGVLAAFILVSHDPDWYYSIMPGDLAGMRTPAASTESLEATLYDSGNGGLAVFASSLFTHNAQIAIFAFALGFAFCLPTILLMTYNGAIIGAFLALYASRGLGFELGGWLLIHGVTELFAIILAGAAGIRIGWSLVFAGDLPRLQSMTLAGRVSGQVVAGVVVMLLIAGLLEGFGRQLITDDLVRYGIAAFSGLLWLFYFYRRLPASQEQVAKR